MNFEYDNQTFCDLEIEKNHNESSKSVFSLYNYTLTEGGSDYLKHIMRNPISDIVELEARTELIKFLIKNRLNLFINAKQIYYIEKYLNLNTLILKGNIIDSLFNQISEWLRPSNDYYLLKTGCENLVSVLYEFSIKIPSENVPLSLNENTKTIQELVKKLKSYLEPNPKLTWKKTVKLDRLFRIQFSSNLKSLLNEIYFVDAYNSIAIAALKNSFTVPKYETTLKPKLFAKGLRHPFIKNAVTNDVEIGSTENMCFLTGPNMAGKSTFLKSIGIAIYLSHLGFPVPARELRTSLYSGIITTINISDSLSMGYSHFYSEVNRVKKAAESLAAGKRMFVIFDELFRGTNVKDAFEASSEVIKGFAEIDECIFFMSTHIVEIASKLKNRPNIRFKFFDSEFDGDKLKYSYLLKDGVSHERLGLYIIKNEGVFDLLNSIKKSSNDSKKRNHEK